MVDVLVSGAGPAGCIAAMKLARAGRRVLLLDRAKFPRDKLCGDTLNPGAMRLLDAFGLREPIEAASIPLDGMLLTGTRGVAVRGLYGDGIVARAIPRRRLDELLVRRAVEAGAQFQDGVRVLGPLMDEDRGLRVCGAIVRGRDGRPVRVPARLTIAADGRRSTLAFASGLARQPPSPRRWAVGAYFEGVSGLSRVGEMHIRIGHYLGVAPMPDGTVNACLVAPAEAGFRDPAHLLQRRLLDDELLRDRFTGARRIGPVSLLGPLAVDARAAGMPGLLLAGDAAGFIDPMTGDGLRLAMRGAELAADAALASFETPGIDAHVRLATLRARELGGKVRVNRWLRRFVASGVAVRAATLGAQVAPGVLERIIRYAGDIDVERA